MTDPLTEVRACVQSHKLKAAFARVVRACNLNESEISDEARMMFQLGYVEGRDDQLSAVSDEAAKILERT